MSLRNAANFVGVLVLILTALGVVASGLSMGSLFGVALGGALIALGLPKNRPKKPPRKRA